MSCPNVGVLDTSTILGEGYGIPQEALQGHVSSVDCGRGDTGLIWRVNLSWVLCCEKETEDNLFPPYRYKDSDNKKGINLVPRSKRRTDELKNENN